MATLTIAIDPAILDAATHVAARRHITLDALIAESLVGISRTRPSGQGAAELIRLMYEGRLGTADRPHSREGIYAERT